MRLMALLAPITIVALLGACGEDPVTPDVETLTPEPAGAPTASADGRLTCLGSNVPADVTGTNLTLPGWARTYADPTNSGGTQPSARIEAFDPSEVSLGTAFSDTSNGRVAVSVPVRSTGFEGYAAITADGFLDTIFFSSHAYTNNAVAAWTWLTTAAERDTLATTAGVTLEAGKGILVGSAHDCDVFGTANVVIRAGGQTDGVVYFSGFDPVSGQTFTDESGRFAVPNLNPGPLTVEAFGRLMPGEPLILLSRADVMIVADQLTAVDLQPRAGTDR